jgi:hypothetical protein
MVELHPDLFFLQFFDQFEFFAFASAITILICWPRLQVERVILSAGSSSNQKRI